MDFTQNSSGTIVEVIEGDIFTPISIFQKMSGTKKFLLESSYKHEDSGRFSFIGANPIFELIGKKTVERFYIKMGSVRCLWVTLS